MEIPMWLRRFGATGKTSSALDDGYVLCMPEESGKLDLDEDDRELMDEPMIAKLTTLVDRHPNIGNWQILSVSPESNALLNDLGRVTESDAFPFKTCRTSGFPPRTSTRVLPADVSAPPWRLPASGSEREPTNGSIPLTPRRSKRLSTSTTPMATRTLSTATRVKPAALRRPRDSSHVDVDVTPESSVQLAWCRAVRSDSTVIVFHNGNLERIGIRHRESQTLYLSDLIDVQNCKDPGYAKLHTGLYIAMMSDAINRVTEESSEPGKGKGKRGPENPGPAMALKRRKITATEELETKSATELACARNFALLNIQYGVYDSPVPASFIRSAPSLAGLSMDAPFTLPPVKRHYHESEYITLTLTSELGSGATGIAHAAILHVTTKDGKTLEEDVVVKVAFLAEQQQRMRHEYETYRRLAKFSVEGVPKIFGLFDDLEGGTVVLVMSPCGDCLWKLRPNPKDTKVTLSPEQRAQFIAILQDIHRAGVQHHDIRPQNLMLTPSGEPIIVDFDRSTFDPSAGRKRREVERLTDLFEGSYHDPTMRSPPTTPETNNEDDD
ncbi:hypothetical protein C8R46DRAFT_1082510 [Mycena filopes]|nr:hypothetical protein C8R46DRAFT_1082510 [Mycena filopes]